MGESLKAARERVAREFHRVRGYGPNSKREADMAADLRELQRQAMERAVDVAARGEELLDFDALLDSEGA